MSDSAYEITAKADKCFNERCFKPCYDVQYLVDTSANEYPSMTEGQYLIAKLSTELQNLNSSKFQVASEVVEKFQSDFHFAKYVECNLEGASQPECSKKAYDRAIYSTKRVFSRNGKNQFFILFKSQENFSQKSTRVSNGNCFFTNHYFYFELWNFIIVKFTGGKAFWMFRI